MTVYVPSSPLPDSVNGMNWSPSCRPTWPMVVPIPELSSPVGMSQYTPWNEPSKLNSRVSLTETDPSEATVASMSTLSME